MSEKEKLEKVCLDIGIATEISQATLEKLAEVMETENEKCQYVILGVLTQLEKIKDCVNRFDMVLLEGGVKA